MIKIKARQPSKVLKFTEIFKNVRKAVMSPNEFVFDRQSPCTVFNHRTILIYKWMIFIYCLLNTLCNLKPINNFSIQRDDFVYHYWGCT